MKLLGDVMEIYGTFTLIIVDDPNVLGSRIVTLDIVIAQ